VVPSRQRAHAARLAFAAAQLRQGVRVWSTPDIFPVDAWLIREIEQLATAAGAALPRVLSPAEDWLLWRQCTADATRDIDLLNRGSLAESLRRASALAVEYGIDTSKLPSFAGAEAQLLHKTQQAVDDRYRALGAANIQSLIAQLANGSGSDARATHEITCAGFLKLSPRLEGIGTLHRSADPHATSPAVVIARDDSDELERIARWCKHQIIADADARLLVILPGSPGGRERLATLIWQAVDPQKWLSPSPGESSSENLVVIEGGAPLADVPVVVHALSTLRWLGGSSGEFEEISEWLRAPYWDTPRAGIRARMDLWLRESGQMSINGREWVSILSAAPAPIAEGAHELGRQIAAGIQALGEGSVSPRDWSERFRAALDAVHWPGERVRDSSEQQTVVRLHELLDEFGQLASSAGVMSRDDAIHWFSELALRTAFRPADDDAVVTISAALADPVVLYDGIWVAGLHAEAFPQPVQPDPFLPLPAQVAAGIPASSASGRLAEARGLLTAWRAATRELVLSTAARSDDLELLPSPLLAEWLSMGGDSAAAARSTSDAVPAPPAEGLAPRTGRNAAQIAGAKSTAATHATQPVQADLFLPTPAPATARHAAPASAAAMLREHPPHGDPWLPQQIHRPNMLESLDDSVGAPWPPGQTLPSGTRSLELQNLCGFRAYAELRLGSTELGVPEPGVAPDVRGQLLHAALQVLWRQLRDSVTLMEHAELTLDNLIERSVAEAADSVLGEAPDGVRSALFTRECRRTVRLIKRLCVLERSREPFRVQETEFERRLTVSGAQMNVRIDRLDTLESGGQAILDYKSGRRTTADWYGDRPSHPQLLAYLAAVGENVVAMATINVTAREVRFDGIANSGQLLPKVKGVEAPIGGVSGDAWQLRRQEWMACIERLADSFLAGRAAVDPKPGACDWCHAVSVCRVSDGGIDVTAELLPIEFEGSNE
jgi:RecB family exonuclease